MTRLFPNRTVAQVASFLVVVLALQGCQNDEVEDGEVCSFQCDYQDATAVLSVQDVVQVLANAVVEARANGIADLTVAVTDHANNVLAVWDTDATTKDFTRVTSLGDVGLESVTPFQVDVGLGETSADFSTSIPPGFDALDTALDGLFIPNGYAAISKAGTANYFSSQGNAFTTRTAATVIQQNFAPGETDRPAGPLFGVQISQLACSDINTRQSVSDQPPITTNAPDVNDRIGPRRLPVGFSADPGGVPLYQDGVPELDSSGTPTGKTGKVIAGGVGVEFNGVYGVDQDATNQDRNLEERIAVAASRGFESSPERRSTRITLVGRALRFVDDSGSRSSAADVPSVTPADVANEAAILAFLNGLTPPGVDGDFINDSFFFPFDTPRSGVNVLSPASGIISATIEAPSGTNLSDAAGEILVDSTGSPRFLQLAGAPNVFRGRDATSPPPGALTGGLSADDVSELLVTALDLSSQTRGQVRLPIGGPARMNVAIVDREGNVVGFARSPDALYFSIDVSIGKARSAAFWSKDDARTQVESALDPLGNTPDPNDLTKKLLNVRLFDDYVDDTASFLGLATPVAAIDPPFNGDIAWSSVAIGGIGNPDFPSGVLDASEGPLSRADGAWSIFSTGIQTETVLPGIALSLCEEVPDLAVTLRNLNPAIPTPAEALLYRVDAAGIAARDIFCGDVRQTLLAPESPLNPANPNQDPAKQLDCLQGVQDAPAGTITGLQNGFHIFQGGLPIYRSDGSGGTQLVGAIGISGDGVEQDGFVALVALDRVAKAQARRGVANPIGNAPKAIRADRIEVQHINLRYVFCAVAPFLTSNDQTACEGL